MTIRGVWIRSYSVPLREPWPSAEGPVTERVGSLVLLEEEGGWVGRGESAPWPGFGLETHASSVAALRGAASRLIGLPREGYLAAAADLHRLAPVAAQIEKIIPKGACVATDQASYLLMANRFSPDQRNCPHMLDGLGSDLGFSNGLKPSTGAGKVPAVQALWWDEFTRAQFVWLSYNQARRVAWYPQLRAYFKANFVPVYKHGWHDTLWARKGTRTG